MNKQTYTINRVTKTAEEWAAHPDCQCTIHAFRVRWHREGIRDRDSLFAPPRNQDTRDRQNETADTYGAQALICRAWR